MALAKLTIQHNQSEINNTIQYNNLSTTYENGKKQVRNKGDLPRLWQLEFELTNMNTNDAKSLIDFFKARKGNFEPFLIDVEKVDGTIEEVKVRFSSSKLKSAINWHTKYSFSLNIEEVIE